MPADGASDPGGMTDRMGASTNVERRIDVGLSHVALPALDVEASIRFYERYGGMKLVHRRREHARDVVWLSDLTRPFVLVLIQSDEAEAARLTSVAHLGRGCGSREEVDRLSELAREEGRLALGPTDSGHPVGYWAFIRDPDGNHLEISFGQEVGLAVEAARGQGI